MHAIVRARLVRNAEYHAQIADHYEGLFKKPEEAAANTGIETPPPPPPSVPRRQRDATGEAAKPTPEVRIAGYTVSQLEGLVETHRDVAKQLYDLLNDDPPQAILGQLAKPPVTRKSMTRAMLTVH